MVEKLSVCHRFYVGLLSLSACVLLAGSGCESTPKQLPLADIPSAVRTEKDRLNPGDVVQINFPGAPSNNTVERIRLDGHIFMPLVGEVVAAGKTPAELQAELRRLYDKHLQVKEVVVILSSTSASILVTGAVGRPGRISLERPMTVLDAIMEAGGFDPKRANVKKVAVIRQTDGRYSRQVFNLKPVLKGEDVAPFNLQPFDIIIVPEKVF